MTDYSGLSDRELFENTPPDSDKVAELISRHLNIVFTCARGFSLSADYEELVSDGMDGLLTAVRSYDPEKGEFAAFAAVCVKNRMRNTIKKHLRHNAGLSDATAEELEEIPDPNPTPEEVVIERESSLSILENIRRMLTETELRCIEGAALGFTYDEIAEKLGIDRKSVDNALFRARAKLRKFYMP